MGPKLKVLLGFTFKICKKCIIQCGKMHPIMHSGCLIWENVGVITLWGEHLLYLMLLVTIKHLGFKTGWKNANILILNVNQRIILLRITHWTWHVCKIINCEILLVNLTGWKNINTTLRPTETKEETWETESTTEGRRWPAENEVRIEKQPVRYFRAVLGWTGPDAASNERVCCNWDGARSHSFAWCYCVGQTVIT